jgi:hypothetical protein
VTWVFTGRLWYWRGPAPWFFVTVPEDVADALHDLAAELSYGWGMLPVTVRVGETRWTTSLWPQGDRYVVPVKAAVRRAESLVEDDDVTVALTVAAGPGGRDGCGLNPPGPTAPGAPG